MEEPVSALLATLKQEQERHQLVHTAVLVHLQQEVRQHARFARLGSSCLRKTLSLQLLVGVEFAGQARTRPLSGQRLAMNARLVISILSLGLPSVSLVRLDSSTAMLASGGVKCAQQVKQRSSWVEIQATLA